GAHFSPLINPAAMKEVCFVFAVFVFQILHAQRVGIGTTNPLARLHVADSSVAFTATGDVPSSPAVLPPVSGAGRRMMWFPDRAAFRAGYVDDGSWDRDNIGKYSFATGYRTKAGFASIAGGYITVATGGLATAFGYLATASGEYAVAMGVNVIASGQHSVAMGRAVWANGKGSFYLGDSDPHNAGLAGSSTPNEMAMRFNGGYWFLTNNAGGGAIGVRVPAGSNSWTTISDAKLKENFLPVDGELFLQRISKLPLTTWNYKTQDPKTFRHYGPMAQDFYAAFGKDAYGTIGCDTLINQQDFLGVNLIAIQALEKRTTQLAAENQDLKKQNANLTAGQEALIVRLEKLEKLLLNK
ncbi:MAG TPA: tail fiber domain-containing protein, partial [Anaerolineae bacterium]|nr:tail fiber domain-containing protein [Anaerolineae bacterium]